jgi:hypothetical protein
VLGAEIISMSLKLRPTTEPLGALLQELQAHDIMIESTEEVAGLPAGTSQSPDTSLRREPLPVGISASPAWATPPDLLPVRPRLVEEPSERIDGERPSMTKRQRRTLGAVLVIGAIACVPAAHLARRLLLDED